MLLEKQVAIVTGGGRGLGRAVAIELARLGAHVVIASRNAPELDAVVLAIKRAGGRALAQTADVTDPRQVQELVVATERWVGPATIVVNNAGVTEPIAPLVETSPAQWLRNLAVNIGGPYLVTRATLPGMLERSYGRIVNITGGPATNPSAWRTAYASSKAALLMLTRSLALELEGTGVAVCAFHPGAMETEQQRVTQAATAGLGTGTPLAADAREPALVAPVVAYLASPASSPNGAVLSMSDEELRKAAAAALAAG